MQRRKKILLWSMAIAGAFILVALAFPVLAPRIIDLRAVKDRIEARLSQAIGGTVTFDRIDVAILPRPRVMARQPSIAVRGAFEATAESLSIYPKILPLFIGRLRASQITVEAPDLTVRLSAASAGEAEAKQPATLAALKQSLADAGARLAALAPSLAVVIERGRAFVSLAKHRPVRMEKLDARIVLPPRGFSVRMTCSTSFWKDLAMDVKLDPRTLAAEGSLTVEEFRPHLLDPYLFPDGRSPIGESLMDLDLSFKTDGVSYLQAEGGGSAPHLRLLRGAKVLHIESARFKGSFEISQQRTVVTLDRLSAASPRLSLKGRLQSDAAAPRSTMMVTGSTIDIRELRHAVLFFARDVRAVQTVFDVLRAGVVPVITFESSGAVPSDLTDLRQMRITADLQDGSVDIPRTPLHLTGVGGKTVIAGGILQAEGLSARMGNTTGQNGTLRLGLQGGDAPFHLDMPMEADLAELPPLLKTFVRNPAFSRELDLISGIRGTARGRLVLGERLRSMNVTADVSAFELKARYQRAPFPLQFSGGRFLLAGKSISLEHVRGTLGRSSLKKLAARVDLSGRPRIDIASAEAMLSLEELHSWLSSFPTVGEALKDIDTVQGTVGVTVQRATIPFADLKNARFTAAGSVNSLTIGLKQLPGPVIISRGSFTADREAFVFANADASLLDSSFNISGRLDGYLGPPGGGQVTLSGDLEERAARWLSQQLGIPQGFDIKVPLSLSRVRLSWQGRNTLSCTGTIAFPKGPSVTLDAVRNPHRLAINALQIRDGNDTMEGMLKFEQRVLDIAIAGTIREDTLMKVFANEQLLHGRLSGKFEARVPLDRPQELTVSGTIEGERLPLLGLTVPAVIDRVALRGDGKRITADAVNVTVGDMHLSSSGTIEASPEAFLIDGALSADRLDIDQFRKTPATKNEEHGGNEMQKSSPTSTWAFPVRGVVRLRANTITSGRLSAGPVSADITLGSDGYRAAITKAAVCGISLTGTVAVTAGGTALDLQAAASGQKMESTMSCLSQDSIQSTGVFDLKAHLTTRGQTQELTSKLGGTVEFRARNGKIRRGIVLMRVLALLNVTELLRGRIPDPGKEGIAYTTFTIRGQVMDGTVQVSEAVLDGSAVTISGSGTVNIPNKSIDAMFLVAPFKTFDAVINAIPGVRYIMGGNLIAVPVRVRGALSEPSVDVMKPSDVGDQLVGLTTRVLKLPFKIVEPVIPEGTKKP